MTDTQRWHEIFEVAVPAVSPLDPDLILAHAPPERQHARLRLVPIMATITAVAIIAAVLTVVLPRPGSKSAPSADNARQDYAALVLRPGDRVDAWGSIYSPDGRSARFCDPDEGVATAPRESLRCYFSVPITGVDLHRLADRQVRGREIRGWAHVDGLWTGTGVRVRRQTAGRPAAERPDAGLPTACTPPPAGWPRQSEVGPITYGPLAAYARAHPGTVIVPSVYFPGPDQKVVFALVAGDAEPARRILERAYHGSVCVVASRYTRAQADAAAAAFFGHISKLITGGQGSDVSRAGQLQVTVQAVLVTPELAHRAERQPVGLVHLDPWLSP